MLAAAVFAVSAAGSAHAGINLGVNISDGKVTDFQLSVSKYYNVPQTQVVAVSAKSVPDDELPVVFFLASKTGASTQAIIDLRLKGTSWIDISLKFGKDAGVFYVPVEKRKGPPYGKAYGYYKNKPKDGWKSERPDDGEVVNLVNTRFMSEYHGISPEEVGEMRNEGRKYSDIDRDVKEKKKKGKGGKDKGGKDKGGDKGGKGGKNKGGDDDHSSHGDHGGGGKGRGKN